MFLFKTNIKIEEPEYLNSSNKDEFLICSQGENPSIITESYFSKNEESVIENEPPLQVESEGEDEDEDEQVDVESEDEPSLQVESEAEEEFYVISIDDVPYFYEKNFELATTKVYTMTRSINNINNREFKNSYIRENENCCEELSLNVVRHIDLFIFSYDYVLHSIKIHKVTNF